MTASIKKIAKEVGVTPPTVSKALNDRPGLSTELRAEIKKVAERMGYAPYLAARSTGMYNKSIKTIATIYPRLGAHLVEPLQFATDKIFYNHDYYELRYIIDVANLKYRQELENEVLIKRLLNDQKVSGVMFAFVGVSDVVLAQFHKKGIPTIVLNNYTDYGKCITINNDKAMNSITESLIQLGHKKIGLIMPNENSEKVWKDRLNGHKRSLQEHGLRYDPSYLMHEWTFKLENSSYVTKKLLQEHPDITAIIYGNDLQAYGGLKTLHDLNKKIPDDIAIVGFDDMDFNLVTVPSLSSVSQPIAQMGEMGATSLIAAINAKDFSHDCVELECTLTLRGSCLKNYTETFWG